MSRPVLPGATLGVLGGGQLGRMFAIAARRMGYRVTVFAPQDDTPAGQLADREIRAPYADLEAVEDFARGVDVVTFEFENIPAATAEAAARHAPVRPAGRLLHTTQNRLREKSSLVTHGLPVAPFASIQEAADIHAAAEQIGFPAVLKTAAWGYDGKGQQRVDDRAGLERAVAAFDGHPTILEAFVPFAAELSVVGARGLDGSVALYEPVRNDHVHHVLDVTTAPAGVPADVAEEAQRIARAVLEAFEVVGVLCVELFLQEDGGLLINELAPRPHNSGHITLNAHRCDQFEQQLRAICGLPLGSTARCVPAAAMVNLLGDLWSHGEPPWAAALADPDVRLHLYAKGEPRPGRKMGHLTVAAATVDEAVARARKARDALAHPQPEAAWMSI